MNENYIIKQLDDLFKIAREPKNESNAFVTLNINNKKCIILISGVKFAIETYNFDFKVQYIFDLYLDILIKYKQSVLTIEEIQLIYDNEIMHKYIECEIIKELKHNSASIKFNEESTFADLLLINICNAFK